MTPPAPPSRFNIAEHLLAPNAARADRIAYIDDHTRLSYGELATRTRQFAQALRTQGLRREERVLLLAHDSVEWPIAFLGALHAGVVPVAVNTMLTVDDYAYMLAHSRARAAIVSPALAATVAGAMARASHDIGHVIVCGTPATSGTATAATADLPGHLDFASLVSEAKPAPAPTDTLADDMAFWLYSSGSTGRPKAAVHTHANLHWT